MLVSVTELGDGVYVLTVVGALKIVIDDNNDDDDDDNDLYICCLGELSVLKMTLLFLMSSVV